ncbi:stromal antigen 1 (predicted), isoform CRA_c [Rattus norvegicus]|uniref:Stromal antigen 1 (Predicted), isoform CRA_c n=1 Tax=Rattus norvegicus TaxID=10116 RepID=A6I2F9_RAT|nr:stromal antigen 1 (predicted), isoform CRA_c [Rattus norvegicus]EDL77420.1 stromal antigen 1 (predicted), isoform CRA_c [Rattus norvegicus]
MKLLPILMLAANLKKQRSKEREKGVVLAGLQYVLCFVFMLQYFPINKLEINCLSILVLMLLIVYGFYSSNIEEILGNFALA